LQGLIETNPGCRIPSLPEKSLWLNLNISSKDMLVERKKKFEEFLRYISKHEYLKKNIHFLNFIMPKFERTKVDTQKYLLDKLSNLSSYIPNVFNQNKVNYIPKDAELEKNMENIVRLYDAVSKLSSHIVK
jgi:hypothetical protein